MDRALPNTSDTTPDTAGGSLSSVETWEEEEGSSLLEDVTAPENSTEPSALPGAGDSADMASPPKKVRILLGAGEQLWPVALCVALCVALWSGCIPHIPLATLGSCCLAPCRRSSLFADAVLCVQSRGEPQIAQVSLDTAALLCAPAECGILNLYSSQELFALTGWSCPSSS